MNAFAEDIKRHVERTIIPSIGSVWKFVVTAPDECVLDLGDIVINFYVDPRDKDVSSTILFVEYREKLSEKIDTHVAVRLCDKGPGEQTAKGGLNPVALEVCLANQIIMAIREGRHDPSDFYHFWLGYNTAYTDQFT